MARVGGGRVCVYVYVTKGKMLCARLQAAAWYREVCIICLFELYNKQPNSNKSHSLVTIFLTEQFNQKGTIKITSSSPLFQELVKFQYYLYTKERVILYD